MSFNFNWEPLLNCNPANPNDFYERAKVLLTAALNKSPKPPIIVDDIIVNELHLGTSAPELEILEIGDIAEDRFRGIFKLSYAGDAFLELKTKVQVNPLNTYLSTIPEFISPAPVAASSPLTIPVQITLSEFRLSGFVILVFSKAKGITIVFRNDPLESLRVSSTFDTIPFIKEYLQKEIESQVRKLFQEELPVAIHKLSLRLWNPEYAESLEAEARSSGADSPTHEGAAFFPDPIDSEDPFHDLRPTPPSSAEDVHQPPQFSQKNLNRLASLLNSQKTLSVFTPSVPDAIYRAWAPGPGSSMQSEKGRDELSIPSTPLSSVGSSDDNLNRQSTIGLSVGARRSMSSSSMGGKKKKKHRVINLRNLTQSTQQNTVIPEEKLEEMEQPAFQPIYSEPKSPVYGSPNSVHTHSYAPSLRSPSPPSPSCTCTITPPTEKSSPIYEKPTYVFDESPTYPPGALNSYEAAAANSAIIEKVLAMKLGREMSADERGRLARRWGETFVERARTPPPAYSSRF